LAAEEKPSAIVKLTVDYGDGCEKSFTRLAWTSSMTVLDAMRLAAKHPRGIEFRQRGKGATAILTQIDDLKNEGARQRNWIYRVNGKLGDRSFGVFQLQPEDTVLWRFETYR
jgi:hypothetical protein